MPYLRGRVQPDVVAADDVPEELPHLLVAIDDVLGRHGPRVDERVDVVDHAPVRLPVRCHTDYFEDSPAGRNELSGFRATYQPISTS